MATFFEPLDAMRALAVVGAAVVALLEGGSNGVFVGIGAVLIVAVRFLYLPTLYDLAFMAAVTLMAWGNPLGLYDRFAYLRRRRPSVPAARRGAGRLHGARTSRGPPGAGRGEGTRA